MLLYIGISKICRGCGKQKRNVEPVCGLWTVAAKIEGMPFQSFEIDISITFHFWQRYHTTCCSALSFENSLINLYFKVRICFRITWSFGKCQTVKLILHYDSVCRTLYLILHPTVRCRVHHQINICVNREAEMTWRHSVLVRMPISCARIFMSDLWRIWYCGWRFNPTRECGLLSTMSHDPLLEPLIDFVESSYHVSKSRNAIDAISGCMLTLHGA